MAEIRRIQEGDRMSAGSETELLQRTWAAISQWNLVVLEDVFAPDARWLGVDRGQLCEGRSAILEVMGRNLTARGAPVRGRIEEILQSGARTVVAFRPEQPSPNRPLEDGIGYVVVTFADGKIVELKGCADRAAALAYASLGGPQPRSTTSAGGCAEPGDD